MNFDKKMEGKPLWTLFLDADGTFLTGRKKGSEQGFASKYSNKDPSLAAAGLTNLVSSAIEKDVDVLYMITSSKTLAEQKKLGKKIHHIVTTSLTEKGIREQNPLNIGYIVENGGASYVPEQFLSDYISNYQQIVNLFSINKTSKTLDDFLCMPKFNPDFWRPTTYPLSKSIEYVSKQFSDCLPENFYGNELYTELSDIISIRLPQNREKPIIVPFYDIPNHILEELTGISSTDRRLAQDRYFSMPCLMFENEINLQNIIKPNTEKGKVYTKLITDYLRTPIIPTEYFMTMVPKNMRDKSRAVNSVVDTLIQSGYELNVLAIGDDFNDRSMLNSVSRMPLKPSILSADSYQVPKNKNESAYRIYGGCKKPYDYPPENLREEAGNFAIGALTTKHLLSNFPYNLKT